MNNKQVAHLWAHQARQHASGSHFFFDGDTIYSYGTHFPIARHYKGVVLFVSRGYSSTTAQHKSIVRSACSHMEVFTVCDPLTNPSGKDVRDYAEQIKQLCEKTGRARNPDNHLANLQSAVDEANNFCEKFGFKTRFSMPENLDELREKARASAARERLAKIARQAKLDLQAQEAIQEWLAGESVGIPWNVSKTYLRANGSEMETSRGARVPLPEAERAFRFVITVRERGWHRNGDTFKVGDYQLDAVNDVGVVAGCHRIAWDEVERFAKSQGWI